MFAMSAINGVRCSRPSHPKTTRRMTRNSRHGCPVRADVSNLKRSLAAGFTLIEVLVALIVVGLGMLAVIQPMSQTANNTSYIREKTIAHWIAMNQITKVRLEPNAPPVDKSSDEVKMAGRDWRWTMEVKQTPVESIRRIEVSVR